MRSVSQSSQQALQLTVSHNVLRIVFGAALAVAAFAPNLAHADFYNPPPNKAERHSYDGPGSPHRQVPYGFDESRDQDTVTVVKPVAPGIVLINEEDRKDLRSYLSRTYKSECPEGTTKIGRECDTGNKKSHVIVGQPLPAAVVYDPVPNEVISVLRPVPTGYRYVRVDNDVYLVSSTNVVTDVVTYTTISQ